MVKAPKLEKITCSSAYPTFDGTPITGTVRIDYMVVTARR
mgnify:CR=1 FL=1